jgi:hypothetical protein
MNSITVAYASRFGSTTKLAEEVGVGLQSVGRRPQLVDVSKGLKVPQQPLVILTSIIWDRPIPLMREWIAGNAALIRQCTIACGVVCGAAGVRDTGGMVYASQLAKRIGKPEVFQFALSGQIPPRNQLKSWEWWMLKAFAAVIRKPQLFAIRANLDKARLVGTQIAALHQLDYRV